MTLLFLPELTNAACPKVTLPFFASSSSSSFSSSLSYLILSSFSSFYFSWSVCPPGTFKPAVGDQSCSPCPGHSVAPYRGSTECRCDHGYYRASKDPKWFPCTRK